MAFADEVMELTTGTEKHLQQVETEEEDEHVIGLERKASPFAHGKRPDSADSSTITTTNTSSSSSFSGDGERVTIENHGDHDDVNNGNVYLEGEQGIWKCRHCDWTYREEPLLCFETKGSESSDAESDDHESQTVDHLNGEKNVTKFEKGSSSADNKGSREIDEVQDGDIPDEVEVIEEEEVDIEDVKDYKAKELLENHKTPELLCPKCKSCITKVVVLKKRVLKKKVVPKKRKENSPNVLEMPVRVTRHPRHKFLFGSDDTTKSEVSSENPIHGSFLGKCLSCFSIFSFEPIKKNAVVNANPVLPIGSELGMNPQLKPLHEDTYCSNWIVSVLGIKKTEPTAQPGEATPSVPDAYQTRDNLDLLEEETTNPTANSPSEAPPPDGSRSSHGIDIPPPESFPGGGSLEVPFLRPVVEGRKPEILKSIVYGGLTEAITSLGVISSAAGSGASTLNILVLGLANLFSGLILIIHNLKELREEEPIRKTTEDNQTNGQEESRYKRLLGRRENFMLHATIAIFSFIITGLLPPVVYYFSFREIHNKDYTVASVFGASLICITFLALAKAHVSNPRGRYLKSVLYYATNAVSVSGITYVVGNVVNQLLEEYGWSDGSETPGGEMMFSLMGRKAGGFGYSSSY